MVHGTFLIDLATVIIISSFVTLICRKLNQPVVLGYILAGVIIGPNTPPFPLIKDQQTIKTLSELGIVFLMFTLGLEFNLRKLSKVGTTAFIATFLEIPLMGGLGYWIGQRFGWAWIDCIFLGAIMAISSTTIIVKALGDLGKSRDSFANLVFGILIGEDILAMVIIALLSGLALTGAFHSTDVLLTIGRLSVFLVVSLVLGLMLVPRVLRYVAKVGNEETLLISVLGFCFGFAVLAAKLGYSVALGAFVIGAVIAESKEIHRIERLMHPLRDLFCAVFFVSVGLQIDPTIIKEHALTILVISIALIGGKFLACSLGSFTAGNPMRDSIRVGLSMAQIGEFSFIIAYLGLTLGVTSPILYPIAVSVSAITTFTTPYFMRWADVIVPFFDRNTPRVMHSYFDLYTSWMTQAKEGSRNTEVKKILRRIMGKLGVFVGLIAGALICAVFISTLVEKFLPELIPWMGFIQSGLWLTAMTICMPLCLAYFRKTRALGMILAELGVTESMVGIHKYEIRAIVSNAIHVLGTLLLVLFIFALSSAILPTTNVLVLMVIAMALLAWLFRESFNKIYFHGKAALTETFHDSGKPDEDAHEKSDSPVFSSYKVSPLVLAPQSPAIGKKIVELELDTKSGASILAVKRNNQASFSPGPGHDLELGDEILLFGLPENLEKAREYLQSEWTV